MQKLFDDIIEIYKSQHIFTVQHFQKIRVIQDISKYLMSNLTAYNGEIFISQLMKLAEYSKLFRHNPDIQYDENIIIPNGNPCQLNSNFHNTCAIHSVLTMLCAIPEIVTYCKEKLPKLTKIMSTIIDGNMQNYDENDFMKELLTVHQKCNDGELGTINSDVIDVARIFLNLIIPHLPRNILAAFIRIPDKFSFNIFDVYRINFDKNNAIYNTACDIPAYKKYEMVRNITEIKPKFIVLDICMIEILGINVGDFCVNGLKYKLIGTINNVGMHYVSYIFPNNIYAYDNLQQSRQMLTNLSLNTNLAQIYLFVII